jgi:hypothetical protein
VFVTLKMAVVAPMPKPIVKTAVAVRTGLLRSERHAYFRSLAITVCSARKRRPVNDIADV